MGPWADLSACTRRIRRRQKYQNKNKKKGIFPHHKQKWKKDNKNIFFFYIFDLKKITTRDSAWKFQIRLFYLIVLFALIFSSMLFAFFFHFHSTLVFSAVYFHRHRCVYTAIRQWSDTQTLTHFYTQHVQARNSLLFHISR